MLKKKFQTASQLDGVIDLERLWSGPSDSIERDAARFFELTFPSDEIHALLRALSARFSGQHSAGTILAQAVKGLGKSHTLLLAYRLFKSLPEARAWMSALGYDWSPPADTVVLVQKFTDRAAPKDALWLLVADALGVKWNEKSPPTPDDLVATLGSRHLVIVFDELERGVQGIVNDARRKQNLSFLQMLSETANRDARVTLIAAIYTMALSSPARTLAARRESSFASSRLKEQWASRSVYRHFGLSIMENLTPWLVLTPVGSN